MMCTGTVWNHGNILSWNNQHFTRFLHLQWSDHYRHALSAGSNSYRPPYSSQFVAFAQPLDSQHHQWKKHRWHVLSHNLLDRKTRGHTGQGQKLQLSCENYCQLLNSKPRTGIETCAKCRKSVVQAFWSRPSVSLGLVLTPSVVCAKGLRWMEEMSGFTLKNLSVLHNTSHYHILNPA